MRKLMVAALILMLTNSAFAGWGFKWGSGWGFGKKSTVHWVDLQSAMQWNGYTPTPGNYAFGNVSTWVSRTQIFTLNNPGNDLLEVAQFTINGAGASAYSIIASTCLTTPFTTAFNLASLGTCTATVQFLPAAFGSYSGAITASAPNLPDQVITLTGTGLGPAGSWSPASYAFGNATTNKTTQHVAFSVQNKGNRQMTGVSVITGNAVFGLYSSTFGSTLAVGATGTVKVAFTPTAIQSYSSFLQLYCNEIGNVQATLTGTGLSSVCSATPSVSYTGGSATDLYVGYSAAHLYAGNVYTGASTYHPCNIGVFLKIGGGAPTKSIICQIYSVTSGTSNLGSLLYTSTNSISESSLTSTATEYDFQFAAGATISPDTAVVLTTSDGTTSNTNFAAVQYGGAGLAGWGAVGYQNGGTFYAAYSGSVNMKIYE